MKLFSLTLLLSFLAIMPLTGDPIDHWESIIKANDEWHYLVGNEDTPKDWFQADFDDSNWNQDKGGFGYGDDDDGTIIETTLSVYLRRSFEISDKSQIEKFILEADYDDAFVAYLNGVEIARSNIGTVGQTVAFDALPFTDHEARLHSGGLPERTIFNKSNWENYIVEGENVLAIQVNNYLITSSDLSSNFWWIVGLNTDQNLYKALPSWFIAPLADFDSELPIIHINTNGIPIQDEDKIMADMGIIHNAGLNNSNDDFNHYNGKVGIEFRGSSSSSFPKTGYGIETRNEDGSNKNVEILGMPKENDWVLHGPYSDKSLIRNALAYTLAGNTMEYAPRIRFCELILNDDYKGIYLLTEKIKRDKNRVDVDPSNLDSVSQTGFILKIDKFTGENVAGWWSEERLSPHGWLNNFYQYHYPKADDISPDQASYIQNYITEFENLLFSDEWLDEELGWKNMVDLKSLYNFFFINELAKNVDGYRLSSYMFKEAEEDGGTLKYGPVWDFNLGFSNADYCTSGEAEGWVYSGFPDLCWNDGFQIPIWWERFFEDMDFIEGLKSHWLELRGNEYATDRILFLVDSLQTDISIAVPRNFNRWDILGEYVWPNFSVFDTHNEEIIYLKNWLAERLIWMDQNVALLKLDTAFTSTPTQTLRNLNFFPNPFSDVLNIHFETSDNFESIDIEIHTLTGKIIYNEQINSLLRNGEKYDIIIESEFIQNLPKGAYFIEISIGKERLGKQILIKAL